MLYTCEQTDALDVEDPKNISVFRDQDGKLNIAVTFRLPDSQDLTVVHSGEITPKTGVFCLVHCEQYENKAENDFFAMNFISQEKIDGHLQIGSERGRYSCHLGAK